MRTLAAVLGLLACFLWSCGGGGGGGGGEEGEEEPFPGHDTYHPYIESYWPENGSTFVEPTAVVLLTIVDEAQTIKWNTLDVNSINASTFKLYDDHGLQLMGGYETQMISYGRNPAYISRYEATFLPYNSLEPERIYHVEIPSGGIKDLNGNTLVKGLSWSFMTGPKGYGNWQLIPEEESPPLLGSGPVFWVGDKVLIWDSYFRRGGFYDVDNHTWFEINTENVRPQVTGETAVWTGSDLITWGLDEASGTRALDKFNTGARYQRAQDSWLPISIIGAPVRRSVGHTAVWTGKEMIVWGGQDPATGEYLALGGRYDPATDTWRTINAFGAPKARRNQSAVWTGNEMIIWGGQSSSGYVNTGAAYNPNTDSWSPLPTENAPTPRMGNLAVVVGNEMIIWGGYAPSGAGEPYRRYDISKQIWKTINMIGAPLESTKVGVSTGQKMLVWGGDTSYGGIYDPATDTWDIMTSENAPESSNLDSNSGVWTNGRFLAGSQKSSGLYTPE